MATPAPNVLFCTGSNSDCAGMNSKNTDGYVITMKVVSGRKDQISAEMLRLGFYAHCGPSVACVKTTNPQEYGDDGDTIRDIFGDDAPAHLENITLIIEEPAYEESRDPMNPVTRVYWTNNNADDVVGNRNPVDGEIWRYLPSTVMHEFGHTAGLEHHDDYNNPTVGLMGFPGEDDVPKSDDIAAMQALYSGHCP